MKKMMIILIFSMLLGCFAGPVMGQTNYRNYNCFMKDLKGWNSDEFNEIYKYVNLVEKIDRTKSESEELLTAGKKLYYSHKKEIDGLINDFWKNIKLKKLSFTDKQLNSVTPSTPVINFSYTRKIARALFVIGNYFYETGEEEKAAKLLLTILSFGTHVLNGDGEPPVLITTMIGIAVQKQACRELLWKSLLEADFTAEEYDRLEKYFKDILECSITIRDSLNYERIFVNNIVKTLVLKSNKSLFSIKNLKIENLIQRIPASQKQKAVKLITNNFNNVYTEMIQTLDKYKNNPQELKKKLQVIFDRVEKDGQPGIWSILSPLDTVAKVLTAIAVPNFTRANEQIENTRLKIRGLGLFISIVEDYKKNNRWPRNWKEIREYTGKREINDYFDGKPLKFTQNGNMIYCYSVHFNGKDDKGDKGLDNILFTYPVTSSKANYSKALWEEIVEGNNLKAKKTYKKLAEITNDKKTVKKVEKKLVELNKTVNENRTLLHINLYRIYNENIQNKELKEQLGEILKSDLSTVIKDFSGTEELPDIWIITKNGKLDSKSFSALLNFKNKMDINRLGMFRDYHKSSQISEKSVYFYPRDSKLIDDNLKIIEEELKKYNSDKKSIENFSFLDDKSIPLIEVSIEDINEFFINNKIGRDITKIFENTGSLSIKLDSENVVMKFRDSIENVRKMMDVLKKSILKPINLSIDFEESGKENDIVSIKVRLNDKKLSSSFEFLSLYIIKNFQVSKEKANERACIANMKVLEGATEMYLLDNPDENDKQIDEKFILRLVEKSYLKIVPHCPGEGEYKHDGKRFYCSKHGTINK